MATPRKEKRVEREVDTRTHYEDGTPVRRNKNGAVLKQYGKSNRGWASGRPPIEFNEEYHCALAHDLALLNVTNEVIARAFGIGGGTLSGWLHKYPKLFEAILSGKDAADAKVARAMHERAVGYAHNSVKLFYDSKNGKVIEHEYVERYPPETAAGVFILTNRQRKQWKNRQENELTGPDGSPLAAPQINITFDLSGGAAAPQIEGQLQRLTDDGE